LQYFQSISVAKPTEINVAFSIWFLAGEEELLGNRRVELLETIKRTGSITNAAKAMQMSYSKAWLMVAEISKRSSVPLVGKKVGGKGGGGATVTAEGEKAINEFRKFEDEVREFISEKSKKIEL